MPSGQRQQSAPVRLRGHDATPEELERISLVRGNRQATYDEAWLQDMLFRHPDILPVRDLEPGFGDLVPICRELPTNSGSCDNLYLTAEGDIVLAECKLWRNPESRREVLSQVIDYARDLASWSYEDLERAARNGLGSRVFADSRLVDVISDDLDEETAARRIGAISRNLRLGRMLLLVVGDGINEQVERLGEMLQAHAGLHYGLGLVEVRLFQDGDGGVLAVPNIVARTVNIERGIVTLADGALRVDEPASSASAAGGRGYGKTLSLEKVIEHISDNTRIHRADLSAFLDRARDIGVVPDPGKGALDLRYDLPTGTRIKVGAIQTNGNVTLADNHKLIEGHDIRDLDEVYVKEVASLVDGEVLDRKSGRTVQRDGHLLDIGEYIEHGEEWIEAIKRHVRSVEERLNANSGDR
ncbi:hypothetical protein [Rhodovibrio sodomensis]|nr:hypothetical protein [Rhodovibrio sodomensis]